MTGVQSLSCPTISATLSAGDTPAESDSTQRSAPAGGIPGPNGQHPPYRGGFPRIRFSACAPHRAGTFIETDDEIRRVLEAMEPQLIGLCLDTGHACMGGADPVRLADDYHDLLRHVHLRDALLSVIANSGGEDLDFTVFTIAGAFCPLGTGERRPRRVCGQFAPLRL